MGPLLPYWQACGLKLQLHRPVVTHVSCASLLLAWIPACGLLPLVPHRPICHQVFCVSLGKCVRQDEKECVVFLFVQSVCKRLSLHLLYRVSELFDQCLGLYIDQFLFTFFRLHLCYRVSQGVEKSLSFHFVKRR